MPERHIVAVGGGLFCEAWPTILVGLAGRERPRVLYVGTASKEQPGEALGHYDRFAGKADVRRLEFFPWPPERARGVHARARHRVGQRRQHRQHACDLARTRIRRDPAPRVGARRRARAARAREASAGSSTASRTRSARSSRRSNASASSAAASARTTTTRSGGGPVYHGLVRDGFPGGYAADAGVGLHFVGEELREVVACREGTTAYRVGLDGRRGARGAAPGARPRVRRIAITAQRARRAASRPSAGRRPSASASRTRSWTRCTTARTGRRRRRRSCARRSSRSSRRTAG